MTSLISESRLRGSGTVEARLSLLLVVYVGLQTAQSKLHHKNQNVFGLHFGLNPRVNFENSNHIVVVVDRVVEFQLLNCQIIGFLANLVRNGTDWSQ